MSNERRQWYTLDTSAKIYPAVMSKDWAAVFRVSVTLTEPIKPDILQQALEDTVARIPCFSLSLHRGLFWYYLDANEHMPRVEPDVANPCKKIEKRESGGYYFRVRYWQSRIAVEVFHTLADGTGALIFLKTLAARYLQRLGHNIPATDGVLDCNEPPSPAEAENSHAVYARFEHIESRREQVAYHPVMKRQPAPTINIITGTMSIKELRERAKELGVTINDYLVGAFCYAFYLRQKTEGHRRKRPVKISVPINLRSFYPSQTLRNFSLFVNPGIDPAYGEFSFEEIVRHVHHFIRLRLNEKYLNAVMSANVGDEKNVAIRAVPLFLKNAIMGLAYQMYGESRFTSSLSNLGEVKVPAEMRPFVERFDFMLGRPRSNTHSAAAAGFGDKLNLTITSVVEDTFIERAFFTELVRRGVKVTIESNRL